MRGYSAADLERLGASTDQRTAQAQSARQRAAKEIACYRAQAEHFKAVAAITHLAKVQASRLRIAASYERLAALAEGRLGLPQGSNGPMEEERAPEQARVEDLSNDDRRVASAALIRLSRALCDVSTTLVRDTREKLRRSRAETGLF